MNNTHSHKVGDVVFWRWGTNFLSGVVIDISYKRTEILSKNKLIVRNGSASNPVIVILYKNKTQVIKLSSEIINKAI